MPNIDPKTYKIKSLYERYFVYSSEEEALRKKLYGENVQFGTISVNGINKKYTSMVADLKDSKSDSIVVWKGDLRKAKYTVPKNN